MFETLLEHPDNKKTNNKIDRNNKIFFISNVYNKNAHNRRLLPPTYSKLNDQKYFTTLWCRISRTILTDYASSDRLVITKIAKAAGRDKQKVIFLPLHAAQHTPDIR